MRIIGSDEYGYYSLVLSQCNLVVAFSFGWLNQAQLRYFSKDINNSYYKDSQRDAFTYSILFSFIILFLLTFSQAQSIIMYAVSILTIISIGGFNYLKTFYQVNLRPKTIVKITGVQSILSLVIPLLLILFLGVKAISVLMGFGLSFFIVIFFLRKKNEISFLSLFKTKKSFLKKNRLLKRWLFYGAPISIWLSAGLALHFLDRFFINLHLAPSDLGVYASLQEILTRLFSLILFPLTMAIHPRIMKLWNNSKFFEAKSLILRMILVMLGIGFIIFMIFWQFNSFIMKILYLALPQLKNESRSLILPLLFAGFVWQLSFLTHKMLELKEKTSLMILAIIPSIIINIVGNSFFLPKVGIIATGYTALFSALAYCIITSLYSGIIIMRKAL
jgi:O-antigen/teichoic acid export membrane protein